MPAPIAAIGGDSGTQMSPDDWKKMLQQYNATQGGDQKPAAAQRAPQWLASPENYQQPVGGYQQPVPGFQVPTGGYGQAGIGQGQQSQPTLSLGQLMNMVPQYSQADYDPGFTGPRVIQRDPHMLSAALNFYNQQAQLQSSNEDLNLRRALGFGGLANEAEKNRLLGQQITQKDDPKYLQQQHALSFLAQNPNATPAQMVGALGRFNQAMQAVQPGFGAAPGAQSAAGTPPANQGGKPPLAPNAVSVEQQRQSSLGPEVYGWLTQRDATGQHPGLGISDLMTNVYRHDQQNPGYMQQHGRELMDMIKQTPGYGSDALSGFMDSGAVPSMISAIGNTVKTDYSDTEKARAAMRHYMGLSKPVSLGGRGLFGLLPGGQSQMNPHQGLPPIPGSPGAGR